jgi:poly(A) polymerase
VRTLQRLQARGYEAYMVGGCVRDLLLGRQPKDFDIATAARPQQVKRTFPRNCRIIGRRFKLAHLHFEGGQKILEVSTFRRRPLTDQDSVADEDEDLLIVRDNEFGTAEEDALRRDFTVNALFFDPLADRLIDYTDGIRDIERGVLRPIGDAVVRFREDPVRILRAAKFAGRLGLRLEPATVEAMAKVAPDLVRSAPPRVLEEMLRLLRSGHALDCFQILRDVGAIDVVLPVVGHYLDRQPREERQVFWRLMELLDERVACGETPGNAFLMAALFLRPLLAEVHRRSSASPTIVAEELLGDLTVKLRMPRRDAAILKRICGVQPRFHRQAGQRFNAGSFTRDPYFRAALELFELDCHASGASPQQVDGWRALASTAGPQDEPELAEPAHGERAGAPLLAARHEPRGDRGAGDGDSGRRRRRRRGRGGRDRDRDRDRGGSSQRQRQARPPVPVPAGGGHDAPPARREQKSGPPPRRERQVEVIEPAPVDLSMFERELDPRRVVSFGALIDENDRRSKRKRAARPGLADDLVPYKPPPVGEGGPTPPPPPPPPDEQYGDW